MTEEEEDKDKDKPGYREVGHADISHTFATPKGTQWLGCAYPCPRCGAELLRLEVNLKAAIELCRIKCRKCLEIIEIKDLWIEEQGEAR
jgi:hypothetical protein